MSGIGARCIMFTTSSHSRLWSFFRVAACALVLFATGCLFIPIPYTEGASPPLAGEYRRADGRPAAGERVAVSPRWDDSTCSHAVQRATTDSAGRFQLDRTTLRRRGVLLFPPIERFFNPYWVCAGTADRTLHPLYRANGPLNELSPLDSISCLEWEWQGRTGYRCSGARVLTAVDGGHWTDGNARGFFRIIRTLEPAAGRSLPHTYIQWIDAPGVGSPNTVRQMTELELPMVISLSSVELRQENGQWFAWLKGTRKKFIGDTNAELEFELGPPSKVARVKDR